MRDTISAYMMNAMLHRNNELSRRLAASGVADVPEHDQDVRDVVHLVVVHEVELLVSSGHEEQPGSDQELQSRQRCRIPRGERRTKGGRCLNARVGLCVLVSS